MAKESFIGNCSILNWKGKLIGIVWIRSIREVSTAEDPVKIVLINLRLFNVAKAYVRVP